MRYCFGVDIGGTTVKLGLFKFDGEVIEKWEIKTRTEENGKAILPDVAETILKKMEEKGIEKTEVTGVGVGVPGPVVKEREVQVAVNLHWGYTMLADDLEKLLDQIPVKVGNDANVAALGEMWKGGGRGYDSIVMVTLGTGVGGGVILQGKILTGCKGAGGEIGHMKVNMDETRVCGCGNKGCLELYCSEKAILKAAKCLSKPILDFESLVTEYRAGNSAVTEIVNRAAEMFGIGIANIAYLFNPGVVVVGGSYKKLGDSFLDQVNRTVRRHIYPLFYQNIGLQFSALEHDSCLIGIAAVVFDRLLKKPSFLLDH